MSNEKICEEFYYDAANSGVFEEFRQFVTDKLVSSLKKDRYDIVYEAYHEFIELGLIKIDS